MAPYSVMAIVQQQHTTMILKSPTQRKKHLGIIKVSAYFQDTLFLPAQSAQSDQGGSINSWEVRLYHQEKNE
jgi:hypothetical protein